MTDQEISQALHSLLHYYSSTSSSSSSSQSPNPNSPAAPFTSITSVVQYLESKFGVDLSHKADFIRAQLQQLLFQQPHAPPQSQPPPSLHHHHQQQQQQQHHQSHHHHHQQQQQLHPYHHQQQQQQQQQQQRHLQHHHQHYQVQHPHPQIQTQQPSSFLTKDHYALQQSPNFHPGPSPSFFSSPFPGGLSFQSVPTHHHLKPDPTALATPALPAPDSAKASGPSKPKRRGGAGGLNKLCGVSPELEAVVGHPALPRTEIVKQLWAYIRKNNLQDPSNKRKIICNDALRLVFETDCTDMFKMNKLLSKHILPLDPNKEVSAKKQKVADEDREASQAVSGVTQTVSDQSSPPPSGSVPVSPAPAADLTSTTAATQAPSPPPPIHPAPAPAPAVTITSAPAPSVGISDELASFFGVGAREMLQSEVFNRVLDYINSNNLEDPVNPTVVVCDSKLQELFGCQSFPASKIMEVLSRQHIFRL